MSNIEIRNKLEFSNDQNSDMDVWSIGVLDLDIV